MKNRGMFYDRITFNNGNNLEKSFADEWERINKPNSAINFGFGLAQDLFIQSAPVGDPRWNFKTLHLLTQTERMLIATVIQWLGSNCGFSFLTDCLNKQGFKIVRK